MNSNDGALVTGADYRGLGIVRSLGRRRIPVWVLRRDGQVLGAISRYASRSLRGPGQDAHRQLDFLLSLAVGQGLTGWVLFPTCDESVELIARHHQLLAEHYRLTTPPWEMLCWICDKRRLSRFARDLGVDQPWTFCPGDREDLVSLECPFPVVLKPAMKLGCNRLTRDKAWRVDDRPSLLARFDQACRLMAPDQLIVQEVVPGGGETQFSYAALCRDGHPIASIVARRTRQFPMDFGRFSTYVESVDEPAIVEPAVRLLATIRFTGLVELEFKRDSRNGQYKLLDVNPRVWGWHTLSRRAGVDFPYLLWLLATGRPVPEARGRAGERWVRLSADLAVAGREILDGRLALRDYLRSLRGPRESAIFAWDDPLPGLLELPLLAGLFARRVRGGAGI